MMVTLVTMMMMARGLEGGPDASERDPRCRQGVRVAADLSPILLLCSHSQTYLLRGPSVACLPITRGGNTKTEIKP